MMTPLERIAHDIICIIKYGSYGGEVRTADVKRVADYLATQRPLPDDPRTRPLPMVVPPPIPRLVVPPPKPPRLAVPPPPIPKLTPP